MSSSLAEPRCRRAGRLNFLSAAWLLVPLTCGCRQGEPHWCPPKSAVMASAGTRSYHVRAGGPRSYVLLTNAPASNPVSIAFARWENGEAVFRLTNSGRHAILLWNVRVQVMASGPGTDGFGWDTVQDDYPAGTAKYNAGSQLAGVTGEFRVAAPGRAPWRVCAIYSTDWTDGGRSFSGNYEVISREGDE